jgi:hypothetical protein
LSLHTTGDVMNFPRKRNAKAYSNMIAIFI